MLVLGFLMVFVPLGVLLGMQYRWLVSLERTSAIAEKAWLSNYLEALASEVDYFYRKQAERALNIPASYLRAGPDKIAYYFKKKEVRGARYLFVALYSKPDDWPGLIIYAPDRRKLLTPEDPEALRAIHVALSPWKVLAHKGGALQSHALRVDEKDPDNRIILNPITDDHSRVVGVAGMLVDTEYFKHDVLSAAIEKSLPKFFDARARENLVITVVDARDHVIIGSAKDLEHSKEATTYLPFVFSDWKVGLGSRHATAEQWAKSNFLINISLSVLVAFFLLAGIVLALRTASREMKLSDMKSDFVSNVSHELRTPLASIRVFGEFLRLGRVRQEDKIREYGEYIETESRRLTQLINNILDFSKIESGAKTYALERTDIEELVTDSLRNFEVSLRHHGFRLTFERPRRPIQPVDVDPDAVSQALANLIENAVKYSNGSKEITVSLRQKDDSVIIAVKDQGVGISRDEQGKIFERFHRVGTGLVHDVKGSGLGLSIVNHIVKAHGGKVTVESEPNRGSTFRLHLPRKPAASAQKASIAPPAAGSAESVGKT
jgi:signal transduction histidine kinase